MAKLLDYKANDTSEQIINIPQVVHTAVPYLFSGYGILIAKLLICLLFPVLVMLQNKHVLFTYRGKKFDTFLIGAILFLNLSIISMLINHFYL